MLLHRKAGAVRLAGDSRRVTPLACIHKPIKPLDGRMVVANPYLLFPVNPVRIARTASTRISESEDASRRRCRPYDIGRIPVHCCPLPLDNQGDKAPGAGEDGTQDPGDSPAGDSRRVTPLACIHRPVKPLDGRMVVANPYLPFHSSYSCAPGSSIGLRHAQTCRLGSRW